jgi:hypothetical protein
MGWRVEGRTVGAAFSLPGFRRITFCSLIPRVQEPAENKDRFGGEILLTFC